MNIKIIFHGSLKKYNNYLLESEMEIPEGTKVSGVINRVAVPAEEIAFIAVNGSRAPVSLMLQEGDEVKLFQLVAGG